jgi:CRP/FNR family cyclic AMP-dependent transcriptional regulator
VTARSIRLADADVELVQGVPEDEEAELRRVVKLPVIQIQVGTWEPPPLDTHAFAALVVGGLLLREIQVEARASTHLFGPGDVVQPWGHRESTLPLRHGWRAVKPVTLAVLEDRWILAARRWPTLATRLHERLADQVHRVAIQHAITQASGIELRVLGLLWQLAENWGSVGPDGITIPFRLTHEDVGRLVGAQRPTVTLAFSALEREGVVHKGDGGWTLRAGSSERLRPLAGA